MHGSVSRRSTVATATTSPDTPASAAETSAASSSEGHPRLHPAPMTSRGEDGRPGDDGTARADEDGTAPAGEDIAGA
jgi:hypothetical protein